MADSRKTNNLHGPGGRGNRPARYAPPEEVKDFKGTVKKLLAFFKPLYASFIAAIICSILAMAFNVVGPWVLSQATTELFNGLVAKVHGVGGIDFELIGRILLTTLAIYLFSSVCSALQGWIMAGISQKISYRLREAISEKINRMPFGYFEQNSVGDTLSRITNDVDTLGTNMSSGLSHLVASIVSVVGITAMMLMINVPMALITLLLVPISAFFIALIVKFSQKYYVAQQNLLGAVNGQVEETFTGHDIVKAFNQEGRTREEFEDANERLYDVGWKAQYLGSFMKPIMDMIGNIGYVAVAICGAFFAIQGFITVGDIQAFIQYVKNFMNPINQLAQISNVFQSMAAAGERIFEFLDEEELEEQEDGFEFPEGDFDIVFNHVHFGYTEDHEIIHDFDIVLRSGQTIALVGPTGAGKTTIVKLLMRFYDVTSGAITIGGHDIRDCTRQTLREHFGMVLQDTWLFNGTIRENIRYGDLTATDEEVEAAAKAACVHGFIMNLPDGYDFVINEDASNISQGQRQLLTIARAILANPDILIFDEATSSVDTRTEERISEAMDNLLGGRTSFIIAHRLSTVKSADIILVISDGTIVEAGNHAELLEKDGMYARLYNAQFDDMQIGE